MNQWVYINSVLQLYKKRLIFLQLLKSVPPHPQPPPPQKNRILCTFKRMLNGLLQFVKDEDIFQGIFFFPK